MKAITLHQPYASAVALGCKVHETRGWRTHYRGALAIHAGAFTPVANAAVLANAPEVHREAFIAAGYHMGGKPTLIKLPQGSIVAIVELYDCVPVEAAVEPWLTLQEKHWGIYTAGRWAWRLRNIRRLATPIPARGQQGFWDWTPPADLRFADDAAPASRLPLLSAYRLPTTVNRPPLYRTEETNDAVANGTQ